MVTVVPERFKKVWDEWNLRVAVIVSLLLQIFLIFFSTSRKRRGPGILTSLIWVAYLLADWIAAFSVGLISNGIGNDCPDDSSVHKNVAALWAPFLLLHLGGPDNITAFSLEDNELWIRHLFGLLIQFVAVLYIFLQSLSDDFWIPTLCVYIAGTFKYAERTRALYLACLGNFKDSLLPKPDPGPNYAQLMEEYALKEAAYVPVHIDIVTENDKDLSASAVRLDVESSNATKVTDSAAVYCAYDFYRKFRGLIVDHMLGFKERDDSRAFFLKRTAEEAFAVLEYELNFLYDELYTKMAVVHHNIWYLLRIFCSAFVVVSLQQFASHHKRGMKPTDIAITYTLLIGALFLDLIAHFELILSDWTISLLKYYKVDIDIFSLRKKLLYNRGVRWSKTVWKNSLIYYCLDKRWKWVEKMVKFLGLTSVIYEWKYKSPWPLEENLRDLIFDDLKSKAEKARTIKDAKVIYSARGEFALSNYPSHYKHELIARSVGEDVEFDESLLLWHIATELCYSKSIGPDPNRELCKLLSEYMLYLLIMRPTLMSGVAGIAQIRFQDTCEEAKKFFGMDQTNLGLGNACQKLLNVKTVAKPSEVKGDKSKSVLFDACQLAGDLQKMEKSKMWKMMSSVWVELLCYAASHCRASNHAQLLSKGGELVTFVWLLMAHFGLGDMYRIQAGHARAKLIVGK